jgi:hypothetical protein
MFFNFLLIKLAPETIKSKKKVGFIFHPSLMYSRIRDPLLFHPPDPGSGSGKLGIRIRDKTSRIRNTVLLGLIPGLQIQI